MPDPLMPAQRPNIIFVFSDQHSDKATPWGAHPTRVRAPHLARLAEEGTRFSNAFCQSPRCTPSRVSFLSGQYCLNHGYHGLGGNADSFSAPTLFSLMKKAGYRTGVFGKDHTPTGFFKTDLDQRLVADPRDPDGRPYEDYLRAKGLLQQRDDIDFAEWKATGRKGASLDARPSRLTFEDQVETWATDRAIDFINTSGDTPFCLWLSFQRPHQSYTPPQTFWDLYSKDDIVLPPNSNDSLDGKAPSQKQLREQQQAGHFSIFEPSDWESMRRRMLHGYMGCVSLVDACLGRLMDQLDRSGLRENTVLVYASDHGDFAGEHGLFEKQPGISYNAILKVPFLWSWPGHIREGVVVEELTESVDLLPTLLDLAGLPSCDSCDGVSLQPWLRGSQRTQLREFAVTENNISRTIQNREEKLTVWPAGFFGEDTPAFLEFYDLVNDPWEEVNRAGDPAFSRRVNALRLALYDWVTWHWRPRTKPGPAVAPGHPGNDSKGNPLGPDGRINPVYLRRFLAASQSRFSPNL
ncbi:MAG TPA: sulfatase-like hydrolase/transferase [Oceanipulchritudo sp.]|nr:sulfatase-like hydrolase/transferase [Oceanipulchritudo sp.]